MISMSDCLGRVKSLVNPTTTWILCRLQTSHVCEIHVGVTYEKTLIGNSIILPVNPASRRKASAVAWIKHPVVSVSCCPNFSNVWICFVICSVWRFRMFNPPHCHGPWTRAHGNVRVKPAAGNPAVRIGLIMLWHSFCVKVVATNG